MLVCKKCGKVNPDETKFCGGCGTPLEKQIQEVEVNPEAVEVEEIKPESRYIVTENQKVKEKILQNYYQRFVF